LTDPARMTLPADDHVAHRGDGVFETIKCADGHLFALDAHLERLCGSGSRIGLSIPWSHEALRDIVCATVRAGGRERCLIRIIVSRGPGGFGVDPAECPEPALYVIAYELKPAFMDLHPDGATAAVVDIPIKPGFLATIKTCNYLPNALMKAAAHAAGADFPIAFDERGCLAEGATENFGIVSADGELLYPRPDRILDGITVRRVVVLAADAVGEGCLAGVRMADIRRTDLATAAELLVFGTTPDVTSVVRVDGRPVGTGRPGPVGAELRRRLARDFATNSRLRTPVGRPEPRNP